MKRGVWVGGLILSLGGWTSGLLAQEGAWQPAPSGPVPVTLTPSELQPCPAVTIGRPIPVLDDEKYSPLPPALPPSSLLPVSYQPPLFPTGSAAPSATDIPGGNKLPNWDEVDGNKPDAASEGTFASDRDPPALLPTLATVTHRRREPGRTLATCRRRTACTGASDSGWGTPLPTMLPANSDPAHGNPYPYPYPASGGGGPVHFGDAPNELNPMTAHYYASAEYLLWWTKRDTAPALVTTSTDGAGVTDQFGFLNQSSTTVLNGGPYGGGPSSGFRGNAGVWLDTWCEEAVELGGFFLASEDRQFLRILRPVQRPGAAVLQR